MESSYITSAQKAEQLPRLGHPEVCFVGRSNCGKSSLLNALLNRSNLARASNTPGRTQMVNFFAVDHKDKKLVLADLPGYGFSAIGKEVRHHWQALVEGYLDRSEIKECLFLIDSRRADALKDDDLGLLELLTRRPGKAPVTVVLTKADKLSGGETAKMIQSVSATLKKEKLRVARVLAVSTLKKKGIDELRALIVTPWLE
jgi:GTP-binding protein